MSLEFESLEKTIIINEVGPFTGGKSTWLTYSNLVETCLLNYMVHSNQMKKYIFMEVIGQKARRLLTNIIKPKTLQDPEVTYDFLVESFENHLFPKRDASFYIEKFHLRKQGKHETFFEYIAVLRRLIMNCQLAKRRQIGKLRNQLIEGVVEDLKAKFNTNSMSLSQILETGLLWDASNKLKIMPRQRNRKAKKKENTRPKCFRCSLETTEHQDRPCCFDVAQCSGCGVKGHLYLACKYKDVACNKCKVKGHVAKLCKQVLEP